MYCLGILSYIGIIFGVLVVMLVWQHHPRVVEDIRVDKATTTATNSSGAMSNETHNMTLPQPVDLKSKTIEEKTFSKTNMKPFNVKPMKGYSGQMAASSCKDKADSKFIEFIKTFVGETDTYKALNWKIDYLHCKFVSSCIHVDISYTIISQTRYPSKEQ